LLDIVREIGAAAGLASGVGLALLSALYLSHAREVKRLREWAGRAPERSGRGATAVPKRAGVPPRTAATAGGAPASPTTRYGRTGARSVAIALAGLLALGGAAYGVTHLTGDDGGDASVGAEASTDDRVPDKPKRNGAAVKPGTVTVAVLNGTTVPGLAAALSDQIAAAGFNKGTINNFSDQQLAESVVQYAPGHQAEAAAVGRTVGISRREPVTADGRALAADATVIVIAGADKAP
jgi:LytR cell envelope-related transcriptional attenuator